MVRDLDPTIINGRYDLTPFMGVFPDFKSIIEHSISKGYVPEVLKTIRVPQGNTSKSDEARPILIVTESRVRGKKLTKTNFAITPRDDLKDGWSLNYLLETRTERYGPGREQRNIPIDRCKYFLEERLEPDHHADYVSENLGQVLIRARKAGDPSGIYIARVIIPEEDKMRDETVLLLGDKSSPTGLVTRIKTNNDRNYGIQDFAFYDLREIRTRVPTEIVDVQI